MTATSNNALSNEAIRSSTDQSAQRPARVALAEQGVLALTLPPPPPPTQPEFHAPTPTTPETAAVSVLAPRSRTTKLIAALQEREIADVEAALVSVGDACRRGDPQVIEAKFIEQGTLLQALGEMLLLEGSDHPNLQASQIYINLGLRALENSRKTFAALGALRGRPKGQTNVQVNVGAQPHAIEILEAPHEE